MTGVQEHILQLTWRSYAGFETALQQQEDYIISGSLAD